MIREILELLLWFIVCAMLASITIAVTARADDSGLDRWLARSCVGEAGWDSINTGECAAIMHIYRKRAIRSGKSMLRVVRQYSAAVKRRANHPNPWVPFLHGPRRPEHWPRHLSWPRHRPHWKAAIEHAAAFLRGDLADPLPAALHYGGRMDRGRLSTAVWVSMHTPKYRNIFYRIRRASNGPTTK